MKITAYTLVLGMTAIASTAYADIEQGKTKAEVCAACHGLNGISASPEIPNLAGQKQEYLINQLRSFRAKTRLDPTMNVMAESLTDEDIADLTAYFSSLAAASAKVPETVPTHNNRATPVEFPEPAYVTLKKAAEVEKFPGELVWKGGPDMLYNAITPDGKRVLATSPSSNTVYVFDTKNGEQLAVITVGKAPKGVKVSPDGKIAYVANEASAEISVIDLDTLAVVATIPVEKGPHNSRFTKDGKLAYVTLQGGAGIGVIDTKAAKMIEVIPVPGLKGPHNIDLSADDKTAYVRDIANHIAIVDLKSGKTRKIIKVGNGHGGIDVSPDGRFVVTGAIGDTHISVLNTKTLNMENIEVGNGPHGVRASKDSQWIYVTVTKDNVVAVIDTKTMQIKKKISVGQFPFWVSVLGNP